MAHRVWEEKELCILISFEFHILSEKPQKHLAWIYELVVGVWKGMTDIYARLIYLFNHFSSLSPMMHHTNQHVLLKNKLQHMIKELFLSLHSDVAAQLKSDVYVWDCMQGLDIAYRFE